MPANEVITLQCGNYSNHVGAHWWNLQERNFVYDANSNPEINYDTLFREGRNFKNEVTFTPRLLLADLNGSVNTLTELCADYEDIEPPNQLENIEILPDDLSLRAVKKKCVSPEVKAKEDKSWSEYLRSKLHPRSVNIAKEYRIKGIDAITPPLFESYPQGIQLWDSQFGDEWSEKCRQYSEECDGLQGFQLIFDCIDGFSGFASKVVEHLSEEYDKRRCLTFACMPPGDATSTSLINTILSMSTLREFGHPFVLLSTTANTNATNWYEDSALLASFLDTITLPTRIRQNAIPLSAFCDSVTPCGRTALCASTMVPFPSSMDDSFYDILQSLVDVRWTTLTPECEDHDLRTSDLQNVSLRGVSLTPNLFVKESKFGSNPAFSCASHLEMFDTFLRNTTNHSVSSVFDSPLVALPPYPSILSRGESEISVLAALHNGRSCASMLTSYYERGRKIKSNAFCKFSEGGMEKQQYTESLENIIALSENY